MSANPRDTLVGMMDCVRPTVSDTQFQGVSLVPARFMEFEDGYLMAMGALGWHTTWAVLFDLNAEPIKAYETFLDGDPRTFGRMVVPPDLVAALQDCGAIWQGDWEGTFPERRPAFEAPPPPDPTPMLRSFHTEPYSSPQDLLPPQE
ncbi:hypothetical protein [Octadecabacter sp. R77987]|uniref:hypothetical protein n=1 Tax=Octadecabacter sp. R77987 TaxID=3093874 RepID=UPI003672506D